MSFGDRDTHKSGGPSLASSRKKSRSSQKSLFTDESSYFINNAPSWQIKGMRIIQSTKYRLGLIVFNILSITQFILLLYMVNSKALLRYIDAWIILALIINGIFCLDLIAHIVFFGFKRLMEKKTEYLCELLLQIAAQILTVLWVVYHG